MSNCWSFSLWCDILGSLPKDTCLLGLIMEEKTKHEGPCRLKRSLKNASALKRDMGELGNKQPAQEKKTSLHKRPKIIRAGGKSM